MSITITEQREEGFALSLHAAAPALARPFSFGDWRVLPHLNRLQHLASSEERQLEPRLVKLLCFLAANEHQVLSREELVQELWPRVIVNENSLTRAISELRKQLQSANAAHPNYIETIPKRGYRLIPTVEFTENRQTASLLANSTPWSESLMQSHRRVNAAIAAASLCLIIAWWMYQDTESLIDINRGPLLLSDNVLNEEPVYLGGTLQLSTIEGSSAVVESIASPLVSLDEKQYAFIQYDTSGSTIFLGGFGTAIEPVPVYYSNRQLFNLAWSPVGNNLLFARRPNVSTAAVFSPLDETAELLMLNLNTLETTRLVEDMSPADNEPSTSLNLT